MAAVLAIYIIYTLLIKITSNYVCEFWSMDWAHVIPIALFVLLERMMVAYLFDWYMAKSTKVKSQMKTCIERMYTKSSKA